MGTHLYFSNRIELLAEKLAELLREEQAAVADPFADSLVIVPNPNLAKWLQMELARRNGACVNAQFRFLEQGLWQSLAALDPRPAHKHPAMLTREQLQWAILAVLLAGNDKPALAPLVRYCLGSGAGSAIDTANADCARRLWQLSGRMAGYFREYEYHRGDMIRAWLRGEASLGGTPGAMEALARDATTGNMVRCQQALYAAVFGPDGLLPATDGATLSLFQYADTLLRACTATDVRGDPARHIHVFGLSQISRFHSQLLYELGQRSRLNLYHLNVCTEFWEDIATEREERWRTVTDSRHDVPTVDGEDGEDLILEIENTLLRAWGKAGRETIKLLSDLEETAGGGSGVVSEWLVCEEPFDGPRQTVLRTLQDQIALRTSETPVRLPQDRSLQVAACPSVYREVETVYNSILANMTDEVTGSAAGLRLSDIAVLVPDMTTYRPAIASVFDGFGQAPYSLVDSNASVDSVFGQALLAILDLAGSAFTRKQVFELVMNPCFLAGAGITRDDAAQWLQWADRLNVFHSIDPRHRTEQDLPDTSHYTWQQGLRRLRLGRIMDATDADTDDGNLFAGIAPFSDMETGDARQTGAFSDVLERLFSRLRDLASRRMSCEEWAELIAGLADEFLDVPADRSTESYVARRVLDGLRTWAGLSGTASLGGFLAKDGDDSVGLPLVRELVASALAAIPSGKGSYLSGGVTIASLLPMRPLPFRIVYILGLGEGRFPGAVEESALDLRCRRRRIGDVSLPDANRYLFLETLISVREKLYLSYVARDLQKDEELFPCSVLKQLQTYVSERILPADGDASGEFRFMDVPLTGASARYLHDAPAFTDLLADFSVANRLACLVGRTGRSRRLRGQGAVCSKARSPAGHAGGTECRPSETTQLRPTASGRTYVADYKRSPDESTRLLDLLQSAADNAPPARAALIRAALAEIAAAAGDASPAESAAAVARTETRTQVTLSELRRFLESPVEQSVRRHLRLFGEEAGESALAEDEPFVSDRLDAYGLAVETLDHVVRHWATDDHALSVEDCAEFLRRRYRREQQMSRTPEGAFGALDIDALIESTVSRIEGTEKKPGLKAFLREHGPPTVCDVVLGDTARRDVVPGVRLAPLLLDVEVCGERVGVEVTGSLPLLWMDEDAGCQTLVLTDSSRAGVPERRLIPSFLFYLAVLASGQTDDPLRLPQRLGSGVFTAHVALNDKGNLAMASRQWRVHPAMAQAYLSHLLAEYLGDVTADLLPFSVIVGERDLIKPYDPPPEGHSDAEREAYVDELARIAVADADALHPKHRRGPLMDILDDIARVPDDAYAKVARRLDVMLGPGTRPDSGGGG